MLCSRTALRLSGAAFVLCSALPGWGADAVSSGPGPGVTAPAAATVRNLFAFGKSEPELMASIPGLQCGQPEGDTWGPADRSCLSSAEVLPSVRATLVFNLRRDRFVSVALVIDRHDLDGLLGELTRRHGQPSAAIPSSGSPDKVVWLYASRVLILERSPTGADAGPASLLVSADESTLQQARELVARAQTPLGAAASP